MGKKMIPLVGQKQIKAVKPRVLLDVHGNAIESADANKLKANQYLNIIALMSCGIEMFIGSVAAIQKLQIETEFMDPEIIKDYQEVQEIFIDEYDRMLKIANKETLADMKQLLSSFSTIVVSLAHTRKAFLGNELKWIEGIFNGDLVPIEKEVFERALKIKKGDGG